MNTALRVELLCSPPLALARSGGFIRAAASPEVGSAAFAKMPGGHYIVSSTSVERLYRVMPMRVQLVVMALAEGRAALIENAQRIVVQRPSVEYAAMLPPVLAAEQKS